jgi:hypothetical protein
MTKYIIALLLGLASPALAAEVTAITVPVGSIVHVTVLQNGVAVAPGMVTWFSPGTIPIGTITARRLRELEARREAVGDFELCTSLHFGGAPYELAEISMRLNAKEVIPVLKSWKSTLPVASEAQ